jgi:uncharacterized protein YbjT (DUF2867 family)
MSINSLLVFGAAGTQGHPVVDAALEADLIVRAASRVPDEAVEKLSARVDLVEADLTDGDSVLAAMEGMDAVFFHLPILYEPEQAPIMVANVIDAARATGIQRLVFTTGGYCADQLPAGEFVDTMRQAVETLLESGLDVVILRPTIYLANLVWPHIIREIRDSGRLTYPPLDPKRQLNWTATEDQAAIVVACLRADVVGEVIDIASPEPVSGPELCQLLAGVYGREVHYAPQTIDEFAETLSHMTNSAKVGRSISELYAGINAMPGGGPMVDTDSLQDRLDVRLTPVSEWVEDRLGTLLDLYG